MNQQASETETMAVGKARLGAADLRAIERYRRAVNYLSAAQIYLKANPLLEEPLLPEHIKDRLLGHWGTAPGINLIYVHLNRLISRTCASILLITGPGHGAVLPMLHINGFKIANPTIFGTMTNGELEALFTGYGYEVKIVELSHQIDSDMDAALRLAYSEIRAIQSAARSGETVERPRWPLLAIRTPKGWTGPKEIDGMPIEGSFRSHQVPAKEAKTNPKHLKVIEDWLRSYRPEELFDKEGCPAEDIRSLCPRGDRRMAMNPHAQGGKVRRPLALPPLGDYGVDLKNRGQAHISGVEELGRYLRDVVRLNLETRNFRIVCPDELESNRVAAVLEVTKRQYVWPIPENTEHTAPDGRVLEVLSEHNCQGWLQGYLLTGRHGLFPCYEAFLAIVDGMMNQYAKFLKSSLEVPWRKPISSLNYLLTSEAWRQEHNGYSHQGPGFVNNLLTKKGHTYRIYLPPDANCLIYTMDHCFRVTDHINLLIASKQPMPQWLSREEAKEHCRVGASIKFPAKGSGEVEQYAQRRATA